VGIHANAVYRNIHLTKVELELEGDINITAVWGTGDTAEDKVVGFSAIRAKVHLEGDASREELDALIKHADRWSPVANTLRLSNICGKSWPKQRGTLSRKNRRRMGQPNASVVQDSVTGATAEIRDPQPPNGYQLATNFVQSFTYYLHRPPLPLSYRLTGRKFAESVRAICDSSY
jgi:hypothetical protein